LIRKNFDSVRNDEGGESKIVRAVEQKDKRDDRMGGTLVSCVGVDGRAGGLQCEKNDHAYDGGHEEDTTANLVNKGGGEESPEQIPDLEDTINQELYGGVLNADGNKNLIKVVRNETVAGPLGEEGEGNNDPHTAPISRSGEEILPPNGRGNLTVKIDGGFDFLELVLDKGILFVAIGVVIGKGFQGLLTAAFANQPTR